MAETKFYWLRFLVRFFREDGPADYLLSLPNGSEYVVLYLKLWTLTINSDQYLATRCGSIIVPYDLNRIQRDCKFFNIDTVRSAMHLYQQLDLIRLCDNGLYQLHCDDITVGSVGASAKRMEAKRQRDKQASLCDAQSDKKVTTEIDNKEDRYRDIDLTSSKDDDINAIIELYNDKMNAKERKTNKTKTTIKNALKLLNQDQVEEVITYVANRHTQGLYGDFYPHLAWCLGSGLEETLKKMQMSKNKFASMKMRQNYDIDAIEHDFAGL